MEEVLPPSTQSGAGFEPARVRQFTVFLENKVGRLQTLVRTFEEHFGAIVALSVQNEADTALIRLICANPEHGRRLMREAGFSFTETDLLVLELPHKTRHPLTTICAALLAGEININYAYPLLLRKVSAIALCVDDLTLASEILIRKGFRLIGESDM